MLKDSVDFQISPLILTISIGFLAGIIALYSLSFLLGLIILLLLLPLVIKRPFLVIWVAFFTHLLWPYIKFYLHIYLPIGIVFVSIFGFFYLIKLVKVLAGKRCDYRLLFIDVINIILISVAVILFLLSKDKSFATIGFKENVKMCFLFLFIRAIKPSREELKTFIKVFLIVALIVSLYGIYQYFFDYYSLIDKFGGVTERTESYFGLSASLKGHLGVKRAYSLFLDNFTLGYYLMISLIILSVRFLVYRNREISKFNFILLPTIFLCFVLTFTRSTWMGFLLGALFISLLCRNVNFLKRILFLLILVILVGSILAFILPPELEVLIKERFLSVFSLDPRGTSAHYEYLKRDWELMTNYPLGIGLGKATAYIGEVWNESSLFKMVTEMGIIPGILYLLIFVMGIIKAKHFFAREENEERQDIILITSGVTVAYLASGIVFPVWIYWFPTMIAWIFMGVLFNWVEENEKRIIYNNS
ncbi:MAG: O-antigen ligase family protein [Candidatus Helarchaeota archaeon]